MLPNRRTRTWPSLATLAASLVACGGHVEGGALDAGGPPGTPFSGYVTAMQLADGSEELLATFSPSSSPLALPFLGSCAADNEIVAGCCYAPTTPSRGGETSVSAGAVQIDPGGGMPVLSLTSDPQSGYALQSAMLWTSGDVLRVTAAGAAVQSFTGSLHTVAPLEGLAPSTLNGSVTAIDRSQDFSIAWTPGSVASDRVMLWFETSASWIIACTAADGAGQLQVPSDLLQNVSAGDTAILNVDRFSTTVLATTNATITLEGVTGLSASATFF